MSLQSRKARAARVTLLAVMVFSLAAATMTAAAPAATAATGAAVAKTDAGGSNGGAHTWIFITKRGCTAEDAQQLRHGLLLNKFGYAAYTGAPFDVACFPKARLLTVDQTVEKLRSAYPSDAFIFVYDLSPAPVKKKDAETERKPQQQQQPLMSDRWEWNLWLRTHSGLSQGFDYSRLLGKSWIDKGYAVADYDPEVINHEWAHLATCSVHGRGAAEGDPATWQPYQFSGDDEGTRPPLPWCPTHN